MIDVVALDVHAPVPGLGIDHNLGIFIVAQWTWAVIDSREDIFVHEIAHVSDLVEATWLDGRWSNQCVAGFKRMLLFAHGALMICITGRDDWDQDIAAVAELHTWRD